LAAETDFNKISSNYDVLIIGAGSAGIAATVGALSQKSSVLLIEKNDYPGGKATSAYVGTVCGLFLTGPDASAEYVVDGFPKHFGERLMELSDTKPEFQKGGLHFFPYNRDAFISLSNEIIEPATICFNTTVISIGLIENSIYEVEIQSGTRVKKIHPKAVIDCSGEAVSCMLTQTGVIADDEYQAAAQVFSVDGLLAADNTSLNLSLARSIRKGIETTELSTEYERISLVPGTYKNGSALFKLGIPIKTDYSTKTISEIETFSKDAIHKIHDFLKRNNEHFEFSKINFIAPEAGIRTGPRSRGKYILNEEDVLHCKKFDNAIARGSWPIEFWEPGKNVQMTYFRENDFYEIPADCLISSSINNLFFAGRTISATDKAIASARVIGTCLQTGYSSGIIAAGFVSNETIDVSVNKIQQLLFNKA